MTLPLREKDGRFYLPSFVTWPLVAFVITCIFMAGGLYYQLEDIKRQLVITSALTNKLLEKQTDNALQIEILRQKIADSPPTWLLDRLSRVEDKVESLNKK